MRISSVQDFMRQSLASLRILVVLTVLLGVVYPAAVWAVGAVFGDRAAGQPLRVDDKVVGSALLGQNFTGDKWFHGRPSASDYDSLGSAASNLGPSNPKLLKAVEARRAVIARTDRVSAADVPADAVTASGSGLDPQISEQYARIQAARVARANHLPLNEVRRLIDEATTGRALGILGEPGVNVLELNIAIARAATT